MTIKCFIHRTGGWIGSSSTAEQHYWFLSKNILARRQCGPMLLTEGSLMTYTKLLNQEANKHLALPDRDTTLCGCAITRLNSWKRITALEGDECERCAEQAFSGRDKASIAPTSPRYSP